MLGLMADYTPPLREIAFVLDHIAGIDEIITGAGPGAVFGPHVRGWNFDNISVTPLPGLSFFAWEIDTPEKSTPVTTAPCLAHDRVSVPM